MNRLKYGFTLLEVLLVICLVAISSIIAISGYQSVSKKTILNVEQNLLLKFLYNAQQKILFTNKIWLLVVNRDLDRAKWCISLQVSDQYICDCFNPKACPASITAYFYYPKYSQYSQLIAKNYYPNPVTIFNGVRGSTMASCFAIEVFSQRRMFIFFNIGSIKLLNDKGRTACENSANL